MSVSTTLPLVVILSTLRKAERPMSVERISRVSGVSVEVARVEIARLRDAGQVIVYRICGTEYYDVQGA